MWVSIPSLTRIQLSKLEIARCSELLPITICADTHGQFRDVRSILNMCGNPLLQTYLFLGDYVDRGSQSIENIAMLLCFKIKYPSRVYMLRGNHEDANTTLTYGFYDECVARFPNGKGELVDSPSLPRFFFL
ncbi:unnamed protein product [Gongylonema pulchrum]|uniref:Serine/threonine-protein phosphatase n=1 Tax=Gongylonema pulchrum TaxID=637853 RepID=A0A183DCJ5_9BILA|nr:unnamed protein product [Gongylonema pulchrum]